MAATSGGDDRHGSGEATSEPAERLSLVGGRYERIVPGTHSPIVAHHRRGGVIRTRSAVLQRRSTVEIDDHGLAIGADIQAGSTFEVTVTIDPAATFAVAAAPPGVTASIAWMAAESTLFSVAAAPGHAAWVLQPDNPSRDRRAVRDAFVEALAARDEVALRSLWPSESWDALGIDVLETFVPREDNGECDLISETSSHCFVFQQDLPFALGLTTELRANTWTITTVGLDSTD